MWKCLVETNDYLCTYLISIYGPICNFTNYGNYRPMFGPQNSIFPTFLPGEFAKFHIGRAVYEKSDTQFLSILYFEIRICIVSLASQWKCGKTHFLREKLSASRSSFLFSISSLRSTLKTRFYIYRIYIGILVTWPVGLLLPKFENTFWEVSSYTWLFAVMTVDLCKISDNADSDARSSRKFGSRRAVSAAQLQPACQLMHSVQQILVDSNSPLETSSTMPFFYHYTTKTFQKSRNWNVTYNTALGTVLETF